jgi:hypothetical protein
MNAEALGRLVDGSCTIGQPHPARTDVEGACLHAVCDEHVTSGRQQPSEGYNSGLLFTALVTVH